MSTYFCHNKAVQILNYYTGGDTIRVCLFCLSTEFGVDESALFVRFRGVFNSTLITLSESKKVTISSLIFVQPSTLIWTPEESVLSNNDINTFPCFNLTHAIHQVKCNFPNSVVGICTILPRKGKPPNITKCNETV
jgi:hypothetical protein